MIEEPLTFCQELFDRIVDELKERSDVKADDMIRVTVSHPRLDMPICCPFMRAEALTGDNIVGEIERVMQSNTDCDISDGDMSVEFTHTVLPSGSGKVKRGQCLRRRRFWVAPSSLCILPEMVFWTEHFVI